MILEVKAIFRKPDLIGSSTTANKEKSLSKVFRHYKHSLPITEVVFLMSLNVLPTASKVFLRDIVPSFQTIRRHVGKYFPVTQLLVALQTGAYAGSVTLRIKRKCAVRPPVRCVAAISDDSTARAM